VDVGRRETQEPEPGVDEQVLPAIILNEAVPMIAPVELENETLGGVVEIGPANESAIAVMEIDLDVGTRQAGLDQEPSEPSLHGRFGGGSQLGQRA
jgi:hypothetical protein